MKQETAASADTQHVGNVTICPLTNNVEYVEHAQVLPTKSVLSHTEDLKFSTPI